MRQTRFRLPRRSAAVGAALVVMLGGGLAMSPAAYAKSVESYEWYLGPMQASAMWKVSTGTGITVAVVDSGVNAQEPELRGKVLPGVMIGWKGSAQKDPDGHGTDMALLIAGDGLGGRGVQGLAPGAKILPVVNATAGLVPQGIRWAADHGAKIINVSQETDSNALASDIASMNAAVKYAAGKGSLVIAAVGNDRKQGLAPGYPAASPGALGVAAVDQHGTVADFSNAGPGVSLAAPGVGIPGRCLKSGSGPHTGYCLEGGTSSATAIVSASAALIWSAHPTWTNNQVLRVMISSAGKPTGKLPSKYVGYGIVRPRVVLLGKNVDPGPANVNPLYPHLFDKPTVRSSGSTAPAPMSSSPAKAPVAASSSGTSSGNGLLWTLAGVAAVIVIALVAFVLLRRRRPTPPPPAHQPPYGQAPPQSYGPPTPPQSYGPPPGGNGG